MRKIFIVAAALAVLLAVLLNLHLPMDTPAMYRDPVDSLLPDHIYPDIEGCSRFPTWTDGLYCDAEGAYLTVDNNGMIEHTTVNIYSKHITIGQLLVQWGTPSGAEYASYGRVIYWGAKSAYVDTEVFEPTSDVFYIEYDQTAERDVGTWRGFKN